MSELSPRAAALVRAGRGALRPSAADQERVSAALRACLGEAALPVQAGFWTTLFSRPAWAKVSAIGAAIGIAGGATVLALDEPTSVANRAPLAKSAEAPIPLVAPPPVVLAEPTPSEPVAPKAPLERGRASEASAAAVRRPSDRLAQEVAILARATSELHAGRPASALRAIDEHQRKFPNGLLAEERRTARVQALCALGHRNEAEPELQRLAKQAPELPNTLRAKQVCGAAVRPR